MGETDSVSGSLGTMILWWRRVLTTATRTKVKLDCVVMIGRIDHESRSQRLPIWMSQTCGMGRGKVVSKDVFPLNYPRLPSFLNLHNLGSGFISIFTASLEIRAHTQSHCSLSRIPCRRSSHGVSRLFRNTKNAIFAPTHHSPPLFLRCCRVSSSISVRAYFAKVASCLARNRSIANVLIRHTLPSFH